MRFDLKIFNAEQDRINALPRELKLEENELLKYKIDHYKTGVELCYPKEMLADIVHCKTKRQVDSVLTTCRKAV